MGIKFFCHKSFNRSLHELYQKGGNDRRKVESVDSILGKKSREVSDPFEQHKLTNHGETRIKNCFKYDLKDGYRLITVQQSNCRIFLYVGTHDECERWLEQNRGKRFTMNSRNELQEISKGSELINTEYSPKADLTAYRLLERIEKVYLDELLEDVKPVTIILELNQLETISTDDQILRIVEKIDNKKTQDLILEALISLRNGDIENVLKHIDLYKGRSRNIEDISEKEIIEIKAGDTTKEVVIGSDEYQQLMLHFMKSAVYQDWMLFMHPEQQQVIDKDFDGPAKLSGVSGSGKTCIIVKRAIRLAKDVDKPVLIVTLNKSLARLIETLVDYTCHDDNLRENIKIKSFFEVCQEHIEQFEPNNKKLYDEYTWARTKDGKEYIDEVWREYYRCQHNNHDAGVIFDIHKSFNAQSVNSERYIRQEFDWIRSAFTEEERKKYLDTEREGRFIPLLPQWREKILTALKGWEDKMVAVGVIDYIGIATALFKHIDKIKPEYSAVLVDEYQDFGAVELRIIRRLVKKCQNDLFFAGDIAQQIYHKAHSGKQAGIDIPRNRSLKILKNYRNSREILKAAYEVYISNVSDEISQEEDEEILKPEYANFSTSKPLVLRGRNLTHEIGSAIKFLQQFDSKTHKSCIAIAGYTLFELKEFASKLNLPLLDGLQNDILKENSIVLSDLEQTKGYEFDRVCIVNCVDGILPTYDSPTEEHFRDIRRFYVAMTRAKQELLLSYSDKLSPWILKYLSNFVESNWDEHVDVDDSIIPSLPQKMPEVHEGETILALKGRDFLYTSEALGLSLELQNKIDDLVDGIGRSLGGIQIAWSNVKSALNAMSGSSVVLPTLLYL
ncbi:MAG: UvrD-helicase domain-containing protein [Deltaproteobacteria bacterium]|nr:UvrD-helicase domain-containing protein [Deltaproteobacteria bacterium]